MRVIKMAGAMLRTHREYRQLTSATYAAPQKKEYLSDAEADKIRDAATTGPRIVLYVSFAADRIKKLQYEFAHLDPADQKRTDRLNSLINSYSGCIDDAADLLDLGTEKQEDIRDGVKGNAGAAQGDFCPLPSGPCRQGR